MELARRLRNDEILMTGWSMMASPEFCGALAASGFDAVTVDMQHGSHTEASAFASVIEINHAGRPALLRIPVGRFDLASRGLDAGFEAVIAPMINSADDARAFAEAMKYPPSGARSWGPGRALQVHRDHTSESYFKAANDQTLALAMIETRSAIDALDDILAVEGIDGVFVGPSDLSISWSGGAGVDPDRPDMRAAIADIAGRTVKAGKLAAIFIINPAEAKDYASLGYRMMALNTDHALVKTGAQTILAKARG